MLATQLKRNWRAIRQLDNRLLKQYLVEEDDEHVLERMSVAFPDLFSEEESKKVPLPAIVQEAQRFWNEPTNSTGGPGLYDHLYEALVLPFLTCTNAEDLSVGGNEELLPLPTSVIEVVNEEWPGLLDSFAISQTPFPDVRVQVSVCDSEFYIVDILRCGGTVRTYITLVPCDAIDESS